jgi:hypothetical protein
MDFHHIDRNNKIMAVSKLYQRSKSRVDQEVAKCVLICANCHRDVTHEEEHKIPVLKNRREHQEVEDVPIVQGCARKTCSQCHDTKHEDNFTLLKTGYRHSFCKRCLRQRNNKYASSRRASGKKRLGKEYIISQKDNKTCADCGMTFRYWVFDFDHKGGKTCNVANLQNRSLDAIKQEIAKCDLVCACCHRIRTLRRKMLAAMSTTNSGGPDEEHQQINVDINNIRVAVGDTTACKQLLNKYHYARFGRAASVIYQVVMPDNHIIAVVKFSPVVRKEVATSEGLEQFEVLELDRFLIVPGAAAENLGSKIMSTVIQTIKKTKPNITALVSFADPAHGHTGGLYKASNWKFLGTGAKSYYYRSETGDEVNKKTLYNAAKRRGMREKEYAANLALSKIQTPGKHKFIYWL